MNNTLNSLNEILGQVSVTVQEVAAGSAQVTKASQSLSDGSTLQASSLEEVSSSMSEIGTQTRQNADNANQANQSAISVKEGAEQGNKQMKQMLNAMNEINTSSENISKIIKTIDE